MSKFKDNVPGYPGYHVTSDGKVYSLKCRFGERSKAFIIKPRMSSNGYYRVALYRDGVKKEFRLHRLVALVYLPNPDGLPQVCHKDSNPENNCVENLYWGTAKQNTEDRSNRYRSGELVYNKTYGILREIKLDAYKYVKSLGRYKERDIRKALHISRYLLEVFKKENHL